MKISEMKATLVKNYISGLNKSSKWYEQDIADYKCNIDNISNAKLKEMYDNSIAFNSKSFEKIVAREESKLLKAGMFDINKLKPQNSLD